MKKILSVLLCMIMAVGALTGCSTSELAYMSIVDEVYSWNTVSQSGSVEVDLTEAYLMTLEYVEGQENERPVTKVKFDYDIVMSKSQKAIQIESELSMLGSTLPIDIVANGNTIAVSKETIVGIKDFMNKNNMSDVETDAMFAFILDYMGNENNLMFTIPVDEDVKMATSIYDNYAQLYDVAKEFVTTAFKDFDTGLISGDFTNSGIKYEVTIDNVQKLIENGLLYVAEHRDDFISAGKVMVDRVFDVLRPVLVTYEEELGMTVDEAIAEAKAEIDWNTFPTREDIMVAYNEFKGLDSDPDYTEFKTIFEGSNIVSTITMPSSGTYAQTVSADIKYGGKSLVKVTANSTMSGEELDLAYAIPTGKEINLDTIESDWLAYVGKKYPATKATIVYTSTDMESATLEISRSGIPTDESFVNDFEYVPLVNVDDRIYVPMRALAEGLGYQVEWDAEAHKAYVIDGGNKVDMSGMIVNDRTFIKVRDFEKLGLTVDWTPENTGYMVTYTATVSK